MSKFKKFLLENKVLLFLAILLIVWLIAFVIIVVMFFYGSSNSVYGNRLDSIKDLPITEELKENVSNVFMEGLADSVNVNVKGKIVYVNIKCKDGIKVSEIKPLAENSITLFSESLLNRYDIEFIIDVLKDDKGKGHIIIGTRNSDGDGSIIWNNYSKDVETEDEGSAKK